MDGGSIGLRPHRFTVDEYYRMSDAGILDQNSRVELIRGQVVDMAAIHAPHLGTVLRLNRLLLVALVGRAAVSPQNPVRLDEGSEPQPDLAILRPRADDYTTAARGRAAADRGLGLDAQIRRRGQDAALR